MERLSPGPSQVLIYQGCQQVAAGGYKTEKNACGTMEHQNHRMFFCFVLYLSTTPLGDLWGVPSTDGLLKRIPTFRIPKEPYFLVSMISPGSFCLFVLPLMQTSQKREKMKKKKRTLDAFNFYHILLQGCHMGVLEA